MTQIELLQAATPGKWIEDTGCFYSECQLGSDGLTLPNEYPFAEMGRGRDEEYEANAELLRQAKVNALLVECARAGWWIMDELGPGAVCRIGKGGKRWDWKGPLHEMPEEVFAAVLAELAGAK